MEEVLELLGCLRSLNAVGAPLRKPRRMCDIRIIGDAGTGIGYRIDGERRDWKWEDEGQYVIETMSRAGCYPDAWRSYQATYKVRNQL